MRYRDEFIVNRRFKEILTPVPRYAFAVDFSNLMSNNNLKEVLNSVGYGNNKQGFNILIKDFSCPEVELESGSYNVGNTTIRYPSKVNQFNFKIGFFLNEELFAKKLYYTWLGLMVNRYNLRSPRANYEYDIGVQIFTNSNGVIKILETRRFFNCYPEKITGSFEYDKDMKDYFDVISIDFVVNGGMNIIFE